MIPRFFFLRLLIAMAVALGLMQYLPIYLNDSGSMISGLDELLKINNIVAVALKTKAIIQITGIFAILTFFEILKTIPKDISKFKNSDQFDEIIKSKNLFIKNGCLLLIFIIVTEIIHFSGLKTYALADAFGMVVGAGSFIGTLLFYWRYLTLIHYQVNSVA